MTLARPTRDRLAAPWRHVDLALVYATLLLATAGALMIYSAQPSYLSRQLIWIPLGLAALAAVSTVDYRVFKGYGPVLYVGLLVLLVLVLVVGASTRGARAWFQFGPFAVQPSELGKPIFVVFIAGVLNELRGEVDGRNLIRLLGLAAPAIFLIFIEPDLGQSLVYVFALLGMLLVAGARPRHFAALFLVAVVGAVIAFNSPLLADYQKSRLTAFAAQEDKTRAGDAALYNLNQSKIAIGSGGWWGKGYQKGTQTKLAYVPEQYTDFIFTAVGEETGFVGGLTVIALYGLIIWRGLRIALLSRDLYGSLIAAGVVSIFGFQVFQNIGMTMGILPITGLPLPFMSYGGSTMLAAGACIGLLESIHMRRFV